MAYRTIGNTIIEWDDEEKFVFTFKEESGPENARIQLSKTINLAPLLETCEESFLLNLKEILIDRRNRVSVVTIISDANTCIALFQKLSDLNVFDAKISIIDEYFLLAVAAVLDQIPKKYLSALLALFRDTPSSPIFSSGLQRSDFPSPRNKKGWRGNKIDQILGKALSQAAVVHILDQCDIAYASGDIDIGLYSFAHLSFAVFCRANSYRQIRIKDFNFDPKSKHYTIQIITSKTGEQNPSKTTFDINEPTGILLTKQRQHVISTYGHLVAPEELDKLALFPARGLTADKTRWRGDIANRTWGMLGDSSQFHVAYTIALKNRIGANTYSLGGCALRHTVGTMLAQAGASAKTIQAVLRHADDTSAKAYVDIVFHGLITELSDTMRPTFEFHLPRMLNFRSKADPLTAEKRIRSEDLETGQTEDTGECGKTIACENAPIVCYGCFRFRPCWDADHSINLRIVEREIDDFSTRGKPFEHMVNRARTAKNRIIMVMNAADRYREATKSEVQR